MARLRTGAAQNHAPRGRVTKYLSKWLKMEVFLSVGMTWEKTSGEPKDV